MKDAERIKEKLPIADFLRSYVKLIPAGRNFKALCPFHSERTPSFVVSPEKGLWYCFGSCGEGGDVIKFVMKFENLDFGEALRYLAERAGIELERGGYRENREHAVLYDIHNSAVDFYRDSLSESGAALSYLKSRGVNDSTIEKYELGFAPYGEMLTVYLLKSGFNVNDLARSGVSQKNSQGLYRDKFQERIVFPIHNSIGRVIAFTGRLLPEADARERQRGLELPKYLNSPETPIFNKSKVLYGLHLAKSAISKTKSVNVVEGQMDVIMSSQVGLENTIAVSGTGLTQDHLVALRRLADTVVMSFDNDKAGRDALERSLDLIHSFDFHVKVVALDNAKDPAELAVADKERLLTAFNSAKPAYSVLCNWHFSNANLSLIEKRRAVRQVLQRMSKLKSGIERDVWLDEISRASGFSRSAVEEEYSTLSGRAFNNPAPSVNFALKKPSSKMDNPIQTITDRLVSLAFTNEEFLSIVKSNLDWLPEESRQKISIEPADPTSLSPLREILQAGDLKDLKLELDELIVRLKIEQLKLRRQALRLEIENSKNNGNESFTVAERFKSLTLELLSLEDKLLNVRTRLHDDA